MDKSVPDAETVEVTRADVDIDLLKKQHKLAAEGGRRKRNVSKSKSTTSDRTDLEPTWPQFKIPVLDPDLGISGEIFSGKGSLTPEQTLVEFISTSASFHGVKKQALRSLEWDLLKVFPFNVMPANAAAWYMAKRKFYMNQSFDQQLLPFLLKKHPEKFRVMGSQVYFHEVYKKDVAKAKLKYLVQYGLNAYFSHKADEYGVYFFDPIYYENTEPFHESLRQVTGSAKSSTSSKNKLVPTYFSSEGVKDQFKFRIHSAYLVSISKQPGIKIITGKTGVIISMINNQYGFIKFGDSGETALFCCKSLFKDGWQYNGDPLRLPAMKFDGYQIPGGCVKGEEAYSWYAVLVWCGKRPSPKFCSTAEDLNSTPVFREGRIQRMSTASESKRMRQPSSSMMVGQVMEIKRNGAVVKVREDSADKVFVPGWQREMSTNTGTWLSTLSGEAIGLGDLVAYYVDTLDKKPGFSAVGKNVMVLKESQDVKDKGRRRRRQSTERSAGARYEVGETSDEDQPRSHRRKTRPVLEGATDDESEESDEDITDGELEWLEREMETLIVKEDPLNKMMKLFKTVQSELHSTRSTKVKSLKKSGIKNLRGGYTPIKNTGGDFWRMRKMLMKVDRDYDSDDDPDYKLGMVIEQVHRPGFESEAQGDTSFSSNAVSHKSSGSVSRNLRADATPKKSLPYWVKEVSKAEKYNPDLEMFEPNDRRYKEENDPDYVLPATDDEIDSEDEGSQDEQEVTLLADEAEKDLPEEVVEGKYKEKKVSVSPVKVTLTPSKEGDEEPVDKILTLESDEDQDQEVDGETRKTPTLWERSLLMTEQPDEYDSDDDPEYVPPAVIVDTDLEYDELLDGEDYEISDNELHELETNAKKDAAEVTPKCYMPIWVPVESPAERISRAKEQFAAKMIAKAKAQMEVDTSCKDTDSNGKKDEEGKIDDLTVNKLTSMVGHMHLETGLTPSMKSSVRATTEDDSASPSRTTDNENDEKSTTKEQPSEPIEKEVEATAS